MAHLYKVFDIDIGDYIGRNITSEKVVELTGICSVDLWKRSHSEKPMAPYKNKYEIGFDDEVTPNTAFTPDHIAVWNEICKAAQILREGGRIVRVNGKPLYVMAREVG